MTRKLTGTVKIHEDPSIYVYDTPGVMVPFLGHGEDGAERGLKLALTGSFHFFRVFHAFAPVTRWADEGVSWDQGEPLPARLDSRLPSLADEPPSRLAIPSSHPRSSSA